jgi:hypothetical protein
LKEINRIWQFCDLTGADLKEIGRKIKGFQKIEEAITEDGYRWFWGIFFEIGDEEAVILFPWRKERPIALYIRSEGTPEIPYDLLEKFRKELMVLVYKYLPAISIGVLGDIESTVESKRKREAVELIRQFKGILRDLRDRGS